MGVNRPDHLAVGSRGRGFHVIAPVAGADTALQAWYAGSPVAALCNGMWPDFAPDKGALGPDMPYIVYMMTGNVPDNSMTQTVDDIYITFHIRSGDISPSEVTDIFTAFIAAFDNAAIPVVGWTTVRFDRVGGDRAKDADGGWVWVVNYKWHLER